MSIYERCVKTQGKILLDYYFTNELSRVITDLYKKCSRSEPKKTKSKDIFGRYHNDLIPFLLRDTLHSSQATERAMCGCRSVINVFFFIRGPLEGMYFVFDDIYGSCDQCMGRWNDITQDAVSRRFKDAERKIKNIFYDGELYCRLEDTELVPDQLLKKEYDKIVDALEYKLAVYNSYYSIFFLSISNIPNEVIYSIVRNIVLDKATPFQKLMRYNWEEVEATDFSDIIDRSINEMAS